jgi:YggT family protein
LVDTVFHLYVLALMLRFLLQAVRADFHNPVSQALVVITGPVLKPLRRVIPGIGGIDIATILAMVIIKGTGLWLVCLIAGVPWTFGTLAILTLYQLVDLLLLIFIFTIIVQAIISWVNPGAWNPVTALLHQLNAPLLRPARKLSPPLGGLDLSPLFVLIALQFCRMLLRWIL